MNNYNKLEKLYCKFCNKECKNKNSLVQHEIRCQNNPNRLIYIIQGHSKGHKGANQFTKAKELGLPKPEVSKETRQKLSNVWLGRHHNEETKEKISKKLKQYLNDNPDKVPFLLNHSSSKSYPEQYFEEVFINENIPLKYHKRVDRYELDFYNEDLKKYVEIDGDQHNLPYMIKHDNERTEYLSKLGWEGLRIKWSEYKQLNYKDKKQQINIIKNFLL